MRIGIIGAGRFGKLLQKHLSTDNDVVMVDKTDVGSRRGAFLQQCELIIFAVPNRLLTQTIEQWKPQIAATAIVMDVGSVKTIPCKILAESFSDRETLGTHPLFGPDSAGESWQDRKMVFCKIRCSDVTYNTVQKLFTSCGVIPVEYTPAEHDQLMAQTQALVHFIGRALEGIEPHDIYTPDYEKLLAMMERIKHDTYELFFDMQNLNPYAAAVRKDFITHVQNLEAQITKDNTENTKNTNLEELRSQIDILDEQIVGLIGERFAIVKQIGILKKDQQTAIQDPQREAQLYIKMHELSQRHGVPLEVVVHVYDYLLDQSRKAQ